MKITPIPSTVTPETAAPAPRPILQMKTNFNSSSEDPQLQDERTIEDNKDEIKPVTEVTEPISPQFAALARQRRALQVKERELKEKEQALELRAKDGDQIPLSRLKSEPLRVLLESGVTYEQLTQAILANQGNPEVYSLKAEMEALKQGVDKRFSEEKTQAEQQALNDMTREAKRLVTEGEDFELVRETGSVPQAIKLIERTYRESGEVMDVREALRLVEESLFKRQEKLINLKKVQGLYQKPEANLAAPQQRNFGMRTLTNKDTASMPLDRLARARAAFRGALK